MKIRLAIEGAAVCGLALLILARECSGEPGWIREGIERADASFADDPAAVTLYDYERVEIDRNIEGSFRLRRIYRILHADGLIAKVFRITLTGTADLDDLDAWTIRPGEKALWAGKRDMIETTMQPGEYSDYRQILLSAPKARVGDVVAFECTFKDRLWSPSFRWFPQMASWPVAAARLEVKLPAGWDVVAHPHLVDPRPSISSEGLRVFDVGPLESVPDETDVPGGLISFPHVVLRLVDPTGAKSYESWQEVAAWYYDLASPKFSPASEMTDLLGANDGSEPDQGLGLFASRVQHSINYIAIELGDQGWVPDAAADTWRRRYGDCKDKATVMIAALASLGMEARPVLVGTSDRRRVDPEAPDPRQFNHCIVAFQWNGDPTFSRVVAEDPAGRKWAFFDPTATSVPLGYLPRRVAGTWGVLADPDGGLVRLPEKPSLNLQTEADLALYQDGVVEGTVRVIGEGIGGGLLSYWHELRSTEGVEKRIAEFLGKEWADVEVTEARWQGVDSTSYTASLEFSLVSKDIAKPWANSWIIRPLLINARTKPPAADSVRTLPVWLDGPFLYQDHLSIKLPHGYAADQPPEFSWLGPLGSYELSCETDEGRIRLIRKYQIREELVDAERYPEVKELWQTAYQGDGAAILVVPVR